MEVDRAAVVHLLGAVGRRHPHTGRTPPSPATPQPTETQPSRQLRASSIPSRRHALPGSEFVQTRKRLRASTVVSGARVREDRLRAPFARPLAVAMAATALLALGGGIALAAIAKARGADVRRTLVGRGARARHRHAGVRRARARAAAARHAGRVDPARRARCRSRSCCWRSRCPRCAPRRRRVQLGAWTRSSRRSGPCCSCGRWRSPTSIPTAGCRRAAGGRWRGSRRRPAPARCSCSRCSRRSTARTGQVDNPLGVGPGVVDLLTPVFWACWLGLLASLIGGVLALRARYQRGQRPSSAGRSCGSPTARSCRRCGSAAGAR